MRRSLTMTIPADDLRKADVQAVARLAQSLGVSVPQGTDTVGAWRHRLVQAIQRWEGKAKAGRIALYPDAS